MHQAYCKPCGNAYHREYYKRNKKLYRKKADKAQAKCRAERRKNLLAYLEKRSCVDCGEQDPVVLEFDHRRDKKHHVSAMVSQGISWMRIEEEIAKCDVRCANCHRRRTAKSRGWYKTLVPGSAW